MIAAVAYAPGDDPIGDWETDGGSPLVSIDPNCDWCDGSGYWKDGTPCIKCNFVGGRDDSDAEDVIGISCDGCAPDTCIFAFLWNLVTS